MTGGLLKRQGKDGRFSNGGVGQGRGSRTHPWTAGSGLRVRGPASDRTADRHAAAARTAASSPATRQTKGLAACVWVARDDLGQLPFPPADVELLALVTNGSAATTPPLPSTDTTVSGATKSR